MAVYAVSRPRVLKDVEVSRLRAFPSIGEMQVSPGTIVDRGSILGQYASRQRLRFVRVEVSGDQIAATVLVAAGQKVKRGEVLAYYSYMFGLGYTEYTSPCDGEVVAINSATGQISIKEAPVSMACHLPGTVERVDEAMGVWVRSRGDLVEAAAGAGFARSGILVRKVESPSSAAAAQSVGPGDSGKVLLAGAHVTQEFVEVCLRYRVAGIIAGSAPYRVYQWYQALAANLDWDEFLARYWARELKSKDASAPLATEIVPALVLAEGFGELSMPDESFETLASHEGQEVFLDGCGVLERDVAYYMNAGPCVITPSASSASGGGEKSMGERATGALFEVGGSSILREIVPGARVRLNHLTGAPSEGIVESVPEEEIILPNGISVIGVNVVTAKGERLTVPASNIQVTG